MKCRCTVLLLVALAAVIPGLPAFADDQSCDSALPWVLNLALPRLPKAYGFDAESLKRGVQRFMADFYQEHGRCPDKRPLQVNITIASEYEILDWLSQGMIQAAVIPELTLYLLTERDGLDLRTLDLEEHPVGELLLPALSGRPRSGRLSGGVWRPGDTGEDLKAFRNQLWRAAKHEASDPRAPRYRIVLGSHLSTTGFLDPLLDTSRWLDAKLEGQAEKEELRERFWQAFFDNSRFAIDCDSLEPERPLAERSCWELPKAEEQAGEGPVEILFPGESALRRERKWSYAIVQGDADGTADPATGGNYREHLVIAEPVTETIFDGGPEFQPARPARAAELEKLFGEPKAGKPPRAFLPILEPEPLFGVRTFSFTVDETIRLLRQDQATSERAELALVLPGGGVKAAYQSRIVDDLYGRGYLKNFRVRDSRGRKPLDVRYVIGTSGGALLGFFVSQLRENGPEGLTDILWKTDAKHGIYLRSSDVFGWTDLLRYVSVVASFLVLCVLLGVLSVPERGPLNPAARPAYAAWRLRLTLAVVPLLLFAPLLVRLSNRRSPASLEQVPEFEGLIYAVLALIAMFADQCLVLEREPREAGHPWAPPSLSLLFGAGLIAFSLNGNGWASAPLTFWPAYAVLAPLVLFCGLILPLRVRSFPERSGLRGAARLALEILVPTGLALLLAVPLAGGGMAKVPFIITGFALVLLLLFANYFLRPSTSRLKGKAWWAAYGVSLLIASLLVINLCWPGEQKAASPEMFSAQTLELSVGTFLLCIGLLVLFVGAVSWAYASQPRYHLASTQDFLAGFVVLFLHMMAVAVILWIVTELLPDRLSPLELTGEFWTWLLFTSLAIGLILLAIALVGHRHSRVVEQLRQSFLFLCSYHPNGEFVTRRFLRVAVLGVVALGWWNLVVAPALYGNRQARSYLEGAVKRFYDKAGTDERYHPTSRFIAPANLLERDGTRYFLFVPDGDECPPVPRRPASGAIWYPYSVYSGLAAPGGCTQVQQRDFLTRVIFASGSPFPIFPAHRLSLGGQDVSLVDGGYSNNTPVDAARTVSAEQVLIVESTNPLKAGAEPSRLARAMLGVRGELVENLGRLPGFLFERSQQVDRLSRRDLFVVSISPSRDEKNWPALFDFRRTTVQRMECVAEADLTRRVGMVQSWGRPSFPLSVEVEKSAGH